MIYFNNNTCEIVGSEVALDESGDLNDGFSSHPDGSELMLPTKERIENEWAKSEIEWACIEINKHDHWHARTVSNVAALKTYCNNCRDLVIDGVIQGSRPTRPE